MGTWGHRPWDNDLAADWYGELFEETELAERVAETLNLEIGEYHQEIRAAAYVLIQLGHPYIWPIERLDEDLALAADRLQAMLDDPGWQQQCASGELVDAIKSEIATLTARMADRGTRER